MPTSMVTIQGLAGKARLGAASSVVSLARATGGALGTAIFGALAFGLMHSALGDEGFNTGASLALVPDSQRAVAHALRWMFAAVSLLALAAAWCASRVQPVRL